MRKLFRGVAQMVARMVRDHEAASSSLATPTTKKQPALRGLLFMSGEETDYMRPYGIEACAAWFGKSVCPPPVAEAGRTVLPQRSKNARKSESPKRFSGTARRREAMRPRVQVSPLRPQKSSPPIARVAFLFPEWKDSIMMILWRVSVNRTAKRIILFSVSLILLICLCFSIDYIRVRGLEMPLFCVRFEKDYRYALPGRKRRLYDLYRAWVQN